MFDKIITFVTPGPMTERFSFRARVFYSWISLGLILGLFAGIIISLSSGQPIELELLIMATIITTITAPIPVCLFGLMGLALDSIRGRNPEYPGWYWWLFPILTYLVIGFWLTFAIIGFVLAIAGIRLPQPPDIFRQLNFNTIDPQKFRQKTENLKLEDFLKDFKQELQQLNKLEQQNKLDPEQKKVARKLREFDRSKYENRLRDIFKKDELDELVLLLLMLLGVEVR